MAKETKKLSKVQLHERWLWTAAIVVLALLLIGFMAAYYRWGPFKPGATAPTTGTVSQESAAPSGSPSSGTSGSNASGASGSSGAAGSAGSSGAGGAGGAAGSAAVSPAVGSDIFNLYGSLISGQTKDQVAAQAGGIKPNCTVANTQTTAGKQEVCTYTEGSRIVTVTYLNDRVVSIAKTGF